MSTHNICFYGEMTKIILQLSSNTHLICSTERVKELTDYFAHIILQALITPGPGQITISVAF